MLPPAHARVCAKPNRRPHFLTGRDDGASLLEYGLLVAFIAIFCIGAIQFFGGTLRDYILGTASKLIL